MRDGVGIADNDYRKKAEARALFIEIICDTTFVKMMEKYIMTSSNELSSMPIPITMVDMTNDIRPNTRLQLFKILIEIFRNLHLVLNVICVALSGGDHYSVVPAPLRTGIFTLSIILMTASFGLLLWHRIVSRRNDLIGPKPSQEVVYYSISFASLLVVVIIVFYEFVITPDGPYSNEVNMRAAGGTALLNAGLYLASARMLRKLVKANQDAQPNIPPTFTPPPIKPTKV